MEGAYLVADGAMLFLKHHAHLTESVDNPTTLPAVRIVAYLVVLFAFAFASIASGCAREPEGLPNVKLGMSPRDVRERFTPGGEGRWSTSVGKDDDTILDWSAASGAATLEHASFEFHNGMLVALRATMRSSQSRSIQTTPRTVLLRDGATLTLLARDCPTHHDEAESLAASR